jgi:hypothetical protein
MAQAAQKALISTGEFLAPWIERAMILAEALGASQECRGLSKPGGQLAKYAERLIAAVQKESISSAEKEQLLHQADWMVDTLAGERRTTEQATGLGAAHLSSAFWELPAGRVLITLYIKLLGTELTTPIQAARLLGVDAQSVYRMMYTARLPAYPDFLSTSNRRSHRVRLDHLKRLLAEGNGHDE